MGKLDATPAPLSFSSLSQMEAPGAGLVSTCAPFALERSRASVMQVAWRSCGPVSQWCVAWFAEVRSVSCGTCV